MQSQYFKAVVADQMHLCSVCIIPDLLPLHGPFGHHGADSTVNLRTGSWPACHNSGSTWPTSSSPTFLLPGQPPHHATEPAVVALRGAQEVREQVAAISAALGFRQTWMCCQVNLSDQNVKYQIEF